MPKPKLVKSLEQLRMDAMQSCGVEVFIALNFNLRSTKNIWYIPKTKKYTVLNLIDNSEQRLTQKQLLNKSYTNIGIALKKKALYYV